MPRIDGRATLREMQADSNALDSGLDWPRFKSQFDRLYAALNGLNRLLLRNPA
jgi:hypothetical protein